MEEFFGPSGRLAAALPGFEPRAGQAELAEAVSEALTGDEGARSFIAAHGRRRSHVEVGGEPPDDIDTEADYRRAVARQGSTANG